MNFSQAHGDHLDPDRHERPIYAAFFRNDSDGLELRHYATAEEAAKVSAELEHDVREVLEVMFRDETLPKDYLR